MKVKGELEGLAADIEHVLRVTEFGDLQGGMCSELGEEFNPLAPEPKKAYKYNEWGFYTEYMTTPTNEDGRIDAITADAEGKASFRQEEFLQNLLVITNVDSKTCAQKWCLLQHGRTFIHWQNAVFVYRFLIL